MDFSAFSVFGMVKKRFEWLGQRQQVLAQNIANTDTPKYRPQDLEPFSFEKILQREQHGFTLAVTDDQHFDASETLGDQKLATKRERQPFETSPDGNAVVLEEQMAKLADTQISHQLTTQLYRKHLNMFKIAIGRGR